MSLLNMVYIINKIIVSFGSNSCPYFAKCYLYNFLGFMHKPWDIWVVSLIQPLYENYIPNSPISIISLSFSPLCFQFVFPKLKMFSIQKKKNYSNMRVCLKRLISWKFFNFHILTVSQKQGVQVGMVSFMSLP